MARIFYKRCRLPVDVIQRALWLYFRFTLSLRDVERWCASRRRCELRDDPCLDCWVWPEGRKHRPDNLLRLRSRFVRTTLWSALKIYTPAGFV